MVSLGFARVTLCASFLVLNCFPALHALDRQAARQFEDLANTTAGGLYNFPQEIRNRRTGPVTQEVKISDDGIMTISFSFLCKGEGKEKPKKAHTLKQISLADLLVDKGKFVEVNRHTNTITIFEHTIGWTLVFPSPKALEQAASTLKTLVRSVDFPSLAPKKRPSELAKAAGFRYLVASPRCQTMEDSVRVLSFPDQSAKLFFFLTKHEITQKNLLLADALNASPLCIFDLSVLDQEPFFTLPFFGATDFCPCGIEGEMEQSALSDEPTVLQHVFDAPFVGIRFFSLPRGLVPTKIFCRWHDLRWLRKYGAEFAHVPLEEIVPLFYEPAAPQGTTTCWLEGIHETSDDILRFIFHAGILPTIQAKTALVREFPGLGCLLREKSHYRSDCTVGEVIERLLRISSKNPALPPDQRLVLHVAFFSHELGAVFGPDSEIFYNSWPLALAIAEKMGFSESQKTLLEALLSATPFGKPPRLPEVPALLQREAITASDGEMLLQEWIQLKLSFLRATTQQFHAAASYASYIRTYEQLLSHPQLHNIGLPLGKKMLVGRYSVRRLFSSYIWEERDPLHRDGLSLLRRREKFEHMILEHPHSPWKGRFWDWLNKESPKEPLSTGIYLKPEERSGFLVKFENGQLTFPSLPQVEGELEMMFVVDACGNMYIGQKRDGKGKEETSFSHAGLVGGGPVASAGKIFFTNGRLSGINDHSGHYRSGAPEMKVALEVLKRHGVDLDTVCVHVGAGAGRKKQVWKSARQFLEQFSVSEPLASDDEEEPSTS